MDLRELEHRNLKQPQQKLTQNGNMQESDNEIENDFGLSNGQNNNYERQQRSANDWKLILKLTAALSVCIGLILGFAAGFPIGRITTPTPTVEVPEENENSIYSQYDYTQFVINADKGVTIDSFYTDDEEKYYAMQLIGTKIPSLKYLDSTDTEHTTTDLGSGRYIIEFFEPQCTFCNSMIDTVDKYRETEGSIPIIGLSIQNGDISKFNKKSENSFMLVNKDSETDSLVSMIRWIPTFIYVENSEIKLVTFGVLTSEEIENNVSIAFAPTVEAPEENENSIYSQYDYTQFVINADKGVTIDSFYADDEEKYYAMQLIGTKIPSLKYLDSTDTEHTTTDLGSGRYIIEFFEPQCTFCNSMIDTVDKYRETEGSIPIIGLSIQNGDISKFNKKSENSFMLVNKDSETDSLVNMIRWTPTFIYVENGEIKLVTFGVLTTEEIENNVSIAFTPTIELPEENEIEIGG